VLSTCCAKSEFWTYLLELDPMLSKTAAQFKQMIKYKQDIYTSLLRVCQHASEEGKHLSCSPAFRFLANIVPLSMCTHYSPALTLLNHSLLSRAAMRVITRHYTFPQLMQLTSRFHFLVALGLPGSETKPFSKYSDIQFQCNCGLFWRRCACPHALLLGTYLKKISGGFEAKVVIRKIPSRVGLGKKGKEKAKEFVAWRNQRALQDCTQLPT
jgi:hypothetical protein